MVGLVSGRVTIVVTPCLLTPPIPADRTKASLVPFAGFADLEHPRIDKSRGQGTCHDNPQSAHRRIEAFASVSRDLPFRPERAVGDGGLLRGSISCALIKMQGHGEAFPY